MVISDSDIMSMAKPIVKWVSPEGDLKILKHRGQGSNVYTLEFKGTPVMLPTTFAGAVKYFWDEFADPDLDLDKLYDQLPA